MDKRTATLSCRTTPEREIAAKAVAQMRGLSISDYLDSLIELDIQQERDRFLKLSAVFGCVADIPGKQQ